MNLANHKLDTVLFFIRDNELRPYVEQLSNFKLRKNTGKWINFNDILKSKGILDLSIDETDLIKILDKIIADGFVSLIRYEAGHPFNHYVTTYNGLLTKGNVYQDQAYRRKILAVSIRDWSLAAGTVMAGLYGLFEILKWVFHHFQIHFPF